ncbi:redoxin domain-containing protein [Maricaulis sp.]|uniref:redoxin domain-containing protein n=1 Tax=Maricaulis sp. TaxID=1486257 RepID=UPI00262E12E4|nr:redoxin domain-containing protein [Maricaulis sp.]
MSANDQRAMVRAAPMLEPYARPLEIGAYAPDISFLDERGRRLRLFEDAFAGRPIVLVFCGSLDRDDVRNLLQDWSKVETRLEDSGAHLIIVADPPNAIRARQFKRETGLQAPIGSDGNGTLLVQYGLVPGRELAARDGARTFIISPHRQVVHIMDQSSSSPETVQKAVDTLTSQQEEDRGWIPGHAPVLIVPGALDPADCKLLIEHYENSDGFRIAPPGANEPGDYKFMVADHNRQDRIDHVVRDPALLARLDQRINERVLPMIQKAFAFQVNRRETLHIARYKGSREGIDIGHRDNTLPSTAYRRFALSISLNEDYDGGELVFREYSGKGYRGAVGSALVFSSSLLHEIEETTNGVRYNLISHLFDNASAPGR